LRITTTFCTFPSTILFEYLNADGVLADPVDAGDAVNVVLFGSAEVEDAFANFMTKPAAAPPRVRA
jgi:hypothetical protein